LVFDQAFYYHYTSSNFKKKIPKIFRIFILYMHFKYKDGSRWAKK